MTDSPSRANVGLMFDRIAHRYDLLNRMLSFGQDILWRNRVAKSLADKSDQMVLDLATGTCDLLFAMEKTGKIKYGLGIDVSAGMLKHGQEKINERQLSDKLKLKQGDACSIPEEDNSWDAVTISFGIRNVLDVSKALSEMYRVLKSGGRVIILEFSLPQNAIIKGGYLFYFRNILPFVGGFISGDSYAYKYLNETVETFAYGQEFAKLMQDAGFDDIDIKEQTFGIASIYTGIKKV